MHKQYERCGADIADWRVCITMVLISRPVPDNAFVSTALAFGLVNSTDVTMNRISSPLSYLIIIIHIIHSTPPPATDTLAVGWKCVWLLTRYNRLPAYSQYHAAFSGSSRSLYVTNKMNERETKRRGGKRCLQKCRLTKILRWDDNMLKEAHCHLYTTVITVAYTTYHHL